MPSIIFEELFISGGSEKVECAYGGRVYWKIRSNFSPGALHLLLFTNVCPQFDLYINLNFDLKNLNYDLKNLNFGLKNLNFDLNIMKEELKQLETFCRKFGLCDVY